MLRYRGDNSGIDAQKPIFYIFRSRTPLGFFRYLLISSVVSVSWTIFFFFRSSSGWGFHRLAFCPVLQCRKFGIRNFLWCRKLQVLASRMASWRYSWRTFGRHPGSNFPTDLLIRITENRVLPGTQCGKLALPNDYAVVAIGEDTEWDGLPKDREVTNEVGAILGNFRLYSACRRQSWLTEL